MALLSRVRTVAVAGVTALAVSVPLAQAAPVAAAPTPAASAEASVVASVSTGDRVARTSRGTRLAVRARKVVTKGMNLRGVPYRYGGSTPRGFDCSGFTSYLYKKAGVKLPRTASAQRRYAKRISRKTARRGDLVFFHNSGGRVYHVGIYMGKNRTLHSPRPGRRVSVERIWTKNVTFGRAL